MLGEALRIGDAVNVSVSDVGSGRRRRLLRSNNVKSN